MNTEFEFNVSEDDDEVAYLKFKRFSGKKILKQVHINKLVENYSGPDLYLDINEANEIAGVEILF